MDVVWEKGGEYHTTLLKFKRQGGPHGRAAQKASEIEGNLRIGLNVKSKTTDHGESRIKNCVKYDLGNGFRLVTVQEGDLVVLLYMNNHDLTQRWLNKNRGLVCTYDRKTWKVDFTIPQAARPWKIAQTTQLTPTNEPFLSQIDGVNWAKVIKSRAARSFLLKYRGDDEEEFLEIIEELGESQPDVASLILTVTNRIREDAIPRAQAAVDVYLGKSVVTSETIPLTGEIIRAEANQGRFIAINDLSEAELDRLHDPLRFREWMVFLHPGQRRVVDETFVKPALLTGVSGSGKTCVLIHRARKLAILHPREKVLILTLNQSLAHLIEVLTDDLCVGEERSRIEVKPFHEYLTEVLRSLDPEHFLRSFGAFTGLKAEVEDFLNRTTANKRLDLFKPLGSAEQLNAFRDFLDLADGQTKDEYDRLAVYVYGVDQKVDVLKYLFEELELVRSAFTCFDEYRGYYKYQRTGRSIPFAEKRRNAIISLLREWEKFQLRRGFLDSMGLAQAAVFAVEERGEIPTPFRYQAVMVDEFQDLSTLELSLLRQIPKSDVDGLFLTGDFAQKVYAKDLNLSAARLNRARRTDRVIRRNYRNSKEVLLAAQALLEKYPPQLAGSEDETTVLKPEYATKESAKPIATKTNEQVQSVWQFAQEWLQGGHVPFSVCIATANRESISPSQILKAKPQSIDANELTGNYLLEPNRVVVTDISSVKGFEFSLILICGMEDQQFPHKGVPSAEIWREALRLYVAITRGRDEVRFVYENQPSIFLEAMGDKIQFQEADYQKTPHLASPSEDKIKKSFNGIIAQDPDEEEDALAGFLLTYPPEVLNGIQIMPIPCGATQFTLSRILCQNQTEVDLACQKEGHFVAPTSALPDHIIRAVCGYYRCVANIISV